MPRKSMADLVRRDVREEQTTDPAEAAPDEVERTGPAPRDPKPAPEASVPVAPAEERQGPGDKEDTEDTGKRDQGWQRPDATPDTEGGYDERRPYETPSHEAPSASTGYDGYDGHKSANNPGGMTTGTPKYLQMQRIAGRIRVDQADELARVARALNRRKRGGERITPNTLMRVGIDWLLSQEARLHGTTESEIQDNLRIPIPPDPSE